MQLNSVGFAHTASAPQHNDLDIDALARRLQTVLASVQRPGRPRFRVQVIEPPPEGDDRADR